MLREESICDDRKTEGFAGCLDTMSVFETIYLVSHFVLRSLVCASIVHRTD